MTAVIECTGLTKRFGPLTAVKELDLTLEQGTVLGFLGPNGAGKSTTIRMILGLSAPTGGAVRVFATDPRRPRVRLRVGYAPGELRLDDRLTVASTLKLWSRLRGNVDAGFRDELVERLGVVTSARVRTLSTGNRRKVALVGALMARPELLVLDEPTNGLDPLVQNEFLTILGEVSAAGATVMLSSHVLGEVERVADRIAVIRAGQLITEGPTAELRRGAAQVVRVVFAGAMPDPVALRALEGVVSVTSPGPRELHLEWSGPPRPLLEVLAGYELESFTAPEPDLETAFLSYYRTQDARTGSRRGAHPTHSPPEPPPGAETSQPRRVAEEDGR